MTTRTIEFLVGAFILAAAGSLVFLALSVSGLTSSNSETYLLKAHFSNIGGLTSRANITIAGVSIGEVDSIGLDPENQEALVTMRIQKQIQFLPTDSSASILTSGLLGEKYIGIQLGSDEELLKEGDFIYETQSALVLEDLIGKFATNLGK